MSKGYIGFIVSKFLYNRISKSKKSAIKTINFYEEAAKKNNLIPCYFRISQIAGGRKEIRALVKKDGKYETVDVPLPKVIYNRVWASPSRIRRIKSLTKDGIYVFNEINYLEKYKFHQLIASHNDLRLHLPPTEILTLENLRKMMQTYKKLIIKPDNGFVGRGILKLEKTGTNSWCLSYQVREGIQKIWKQLWFEDEIPEFLLKLMNSNLYLVQEVIPLATYEGSPFDLRVATQRNHSGNWEVTAMIGKVAVEGHFLTNIGQGGTAYSLETLLKEYPHLSLESLNNQISSLAIRIAEHLSHLTPHIADLGFDIGITADGFPYFIECNFLSAYKTLTMRNGELVHEEWKSVFTTPIDYARYLLDNQ